MKQINSNLKRITRMIKVIIADDHAIVRAGMKEFLAESNEMILAGEARDGQELLEKIRKEHYDVILLDVSMPGRNGLEVLKQLRKEGFKTPVLILSHFPEKQYAIRFLKEGASGYMTKEIEPAKLIEAIFTVFNGGKYITPDLVNDLIETIHGDKDRPKHENLTDREYEVFMKIVEGKSLTDIAHEMFLSVKTISTYRTRILEKIDVKSNAELTRYAVSNNLIELE